MHRKDNHRYLEYLERERVDPAHPSPTWRPRRFDVITPFACRPLARPKHGAVRPPPPPAPPPAEGACACLALALIAAVIVLAHSQKLTST